MRVEGARCQVLGCGGADFGFRVSGFGFRGSGFGCRVSGVGFRVSCFVFRVSCFVFRVSCFVFRVSGFEAGWDLRLIDFGVSGFEPEVVERLGEGGPEAQR